MGLGIAIAGAGIGGLATAALLADRRHRVTVLDRFDVPRPVESGLILQPMGLGVLRGIGAAEAALGLGAPITRLHGLDCRKGHRVLAPPSRIPLLPRILSALVAGQLLPPFASLAPGKKASAVAAVPRQPRIRQIT